MKTIIVLAGLLTCSISESLPIPVQEGQWQLEKVFLKRFEGTYSSGSVQDFHLIPFSSLAPEERHEPKRGKGKKMNWKNNRRWGEIVKTSPPYS